MKKIFVAVAIVLSLSNAFAKESKHEFSFEIMMNNGDAVRAYTLGAFQYSYHINNTFWVGLDAFSGPVVVDSGSPLSIQNGDWLSAVGPTFYYNVPALMGATKEKPGGAQCQLYTSAGVGYLHVGLEDTIYGSIGGGLLWETNDWFGIRFDLKSMFFMLENATGSKFNTDLALSIGPSLLF